MCAPWLGASLARFDQFSRTIYRGAPPTRGGGTTVGSGDATNVSAELAIDGPRGLPSAGERTADSSVATKKLGDATTDRSDRLPRPYERAIE
jgi:hypothetical protein